MVAVSVKRSIAVLPSEVIDLLLQNHKLKDFRKETVLWLAVMWP